MRRLRLFRIFLCVLLFGVTVYVLTAFKIGLNSVFQHVPLQSGVRVLHTHWKEITSPKNEVCPLNRHPNISSPPWESYAASRDHLQEISQRLKLNLKKAWVSPPQSLFSLDDFVNTSIPHFHARIPALVHHKGYFLAFCEARFDGIDDWGTMHISMRRGRRIKDAVKWERIRLIAGIPRFRTMNPSPIVDLRRDAIVVVFSAFPTAMNFRNMLQFAGRPLSKVYVIKSFDVGLTWTEPVDITSMTIGKMKPFPVLYVPGPGHSIQMKCGRLVVPGNFYTPDKNRKGIHGFCANCTNLSNIIYSDDGGITWQLGAETRPAKDASSRLIHPNEPQIAELDKNVLYLNARTLNGVQPRAYCYSGDSGQGLSDVTLHASLPEPGFGRVSKKKWMPLGAGGCQGSTLAINSDNFGSSKTPLHTWLLFSNPADPLDRVNLGIRLSVDGGLSWSEPWILFPFKAGYSDLVYVEETSEGELQRYMAVLYEGGNEKFYDFMNFQMFNLEALFQNLFNATEVIRKD